MRADPALLAGAKEYYRTRPAEFIDHWLDTWDPRNAAIGRPVRMPFRMFQRQWDLIAFLEACQKGQAAGLISKARDMGATWGCVGYSVHQWLFVPGCDIGWGSRKQELVDRLGDPSSIFEKLRRTTLGLPPEFQPVGLSIKEHLLFMRMLNPENGNTIIGEIGDNIGRGGRTSMYFKDESAHYERPELVEAALNDNTRVQIDLSSVNGPGTVFDRKEQAGVHWEPGQPVERRRANVFVMEWFHHPEKTQEWYDDREALAIANGLEHIHRQEVDRNPLAAVVGTIIPAKWVNSCVDADKVLGFDDTGRWCAALDVADGGIDANAWGSRKGVCLKQVERWAEVDTGKTTRRAADLCEPLARTGRLDQQYDCIGVGAGVKAEANRLKDEGLLPRVHFVPWNAGAKVVNPDDHIIKSDRTSPLNKDYFSNFKAQAWSDLAMRIERTHRAVTEGISYPPEDLISIPSTLPLLGDLKRELSQAVWTRDSRLRRLVDKTPEGMRSPNLADMVVMLYFPANAGQRPYEDWL